MTYFKFFNLDFFIIFFSILFINLLILSFRNNLASLLNIFDQPNKRKIHKYPTPLVGGICLFITISIALVLNLFETLRHKHVLSSCFQIEFYVHLLTGYKCHYSQI